ncbi:MAG: aspartate kinase [Bacteroidales bacterium]|nr:aspartate kinase [Bacteroidales bacterium]
MKIYVEKFGGASVNSADAVKNVEKILSAETKKRVVVISAMGKTTNKLENIVNLWFNERKFFQKQFDELKTYHTNIIQQLFNNTKDSNKAEELINIIEKIFQELKQKIQITPSSDYNFLYDSIVSFGERISTTIVSFYLNSAGLKNKLIHAYHIIKTDNNYRDANINWNQTQLEIDSKVIPLLDEYDLIITQGFVGGTKENLQTTLGREGSDYSAAVLSHCLNATSMTVWKDVPGLLNADPKRVSETVKILSMPYTEAVELSYYGASIIHPKTIKPLENAKIPLFIKSFLQPSEEGTVICESENVKPIVPNFIFKDNQILLSIVPKDLSFATERVLSEIFRLLAKHKIKVNMMQNSAISFSVCFDENLNILPSLINDLEKEFFVRYNKGLQLVTIRHYSNEAINKAIHERKILIEQKSRITAQYLLD